MSARGTGKGATPDEEAGRVNRAWRITEGGSGDNVWLSHDAPTACRSWARFRKLGNVPVDQVRKFVEVRGVEAREVFPWTAGHEYSRAGPQVSFYAADYWEAAGAHPDRAIERTSHAFALAARPYEELYDLARSLWSAQGKAPMWSRLADLADWMNRYGTKLPRAPHLNWRTNRETRLRTASAVQHLAAALAMSCHCPHYTGFRTARDRARGPAAAHVDRAAKIHGKVAGRDLVEQAVALGLRIPFAPGTAEQREILRRLCAAYGEEELDWNAAVALWNGGLPALERHRTREMLWRTDGD